MTAAATSLSIPGIVNPQRLPVGSGNGTVDPAGVVPPSNSTTPEITDDSTLFRRDTTVEGETTTTFFRVNYNESAAKLDLTDYEGARFLSSLNQTQLAQSYNNKAQVPLENPLHALNNYTYNLSLHMIGITQFNRLLESSNPGKDYVPENVLIASAGKYNKEFARNINFREDFYFDDFKMKTYINTTHRNRNSNLIEMTFTIIEPNGFTLIDRCIQTFIQVEQNNPGNFLSVPYMLQIDFYGYDDSGNLLSNPLEDFRKFIPVRLIKMDTKVTAKGTEYQVQCAPYNHEAYRQIYATLPIATTATGKTVKDIFGKLTVEQARRSSQVSTTVARQRELETERANLTQYINNESAAESARLGLRTQRENIVAQISAVETELAGPLSRANITGFCDAMNEWYNYQQRSGIAETVSSVSVVFDPDIAAADLLDGPQPAPIGSANNSSDAARAASGQRVSLNFNGGAINIPAGTDITKLIDWAVRNSTYISNQLQAHQDKLKEIREQGANPNIINTWLNWFKIVPKIKIGSYDRKLKRYAYDITYYVKKYPLAAKHPGAPKGRVPGFVKQYDYIYTGKNKDIIDFNIELNALYVLEMSSVQNKDLSIAPNPAVDNNPGVDNEIPIDSPARNNFGFEVTEQTAQNKKITPDQGNRFRTTPVTGDGPAVVAISQNSQTRTAPGSNQPEKYVAGDIQRSLTNSAKGEMVRLSLRILGDPHFIKQDDIFSDVLNPISQNTAQFTNGYNPIIGQQQNTGSSLYMDGGELYVFLNFKTPVDVNEQTSLADFDPNYRFSKYNGVYKIMTVDNIFTKGKFEQVLELAKLFYDQEGKELPNVFSNQRQRENDLPVARIPASRYAGPLINIAARPVAPVGDALRSVQQLSQSVRSAALIPSLLQNAATQVATKAVGQVVNAGINEVLKGARDIVGGISSGITDLAQNGLSGVANNFGFEITEDITQFTGLANPNDLFSVDWGGFEASELIGVF